MTTGATYTRNGFAILAARTAMDRIEEEIRILDADGYNWCPRLSDAIPDHRAHLVAEREALRVRMNGLIETNGPDA